MTSKNLFVTKTCTVVEKLDLVETEFGRRSLSWPSSTYSSARYSFSEETLKESSLVGFGISDENKLNKITINCQDYFPDFSCKSIFSSNPKMKKLPDEKNSVAGHYFYFWAKLRAVLTQSQKYDNSRFGYGPQALCCHLLILLNPPRQLLGTSIHDINFVSTLFLSLQ